MFRKISEEFANVKKSADASLKTLRSMVNNSKSLEKVINETEVVDNAKEQLKQINIDIDRDISELITRIGELFNAYNELVSASFDD